MPSSWSNKRERQYQHIKESAQKQGRSAGTAKRIAAATTNKTRSEKGETKGSRKASSSSSGRTARSGGSRKSSARSRSTTSNRGGSRAQKVRAGRKGGRASARSRKR